MGMLDVSEPDCTSMEFQWGLHAFLRSQEPSVNQTVNMVGMESAVGTDRLGA